MMLLGNFQLSRFYFLKLTNTNQLQYRKIAKKKSVEKVSKYKKYEMYSLGYSKTDFQLQESFRIIILSKSSKKFDLSNP